MTTANHLDDELLNEYLDGVLAPVARAEADAHLAACRACMTRIDELRILFMALDALPDAPLLHDLSTSVAARLPRPAEPTLRPALRWAFAAQALLAVFLLAVSAPLTISRAPLADWSQPVTASTAELLATVTAEWQATQATFAQLWSDNLGLARQLAIADASAPSLWLAAALAAAGLLWLAGNSLLLRTTSASGDKHV